MRRRSAGTWRRLAGITGSVDGLRDRSSRPHHSPLATDTEIVGKVIYLRKNYHFGPTKISMYLKRYYDIKISQSGVWRILKRLDMNRLRVLKIYPRNNQKTAIQFLDYLCEKLPFSVDVIQTDNGAEFKSQRSRC